MAHQPITREMRDCIANCQDCATICIETISHCLSLGGRHAEAGHINLLAGCSEICRTSSGFMLRGSEFHPAVCGVCAGVCHACARSCEQLAGGDELIGRCAEQCRRCAQSCERMAGTAAHRA